MTEKIQNNNGLNKTEGDSHTYGVWRLVVQGLYGNLAVGGSDILVVLGPPEAVSLSLKV